ncbi:MAG: hypothetical protein ACREXO_21025, partial [Advenella sp.]
MKRLTFNLLLTFLFAPSLLPETAIARSQQLAATQSADSKQNIGNEPEKENTMSAEKPIVLV